MHSVDSSKRGQGQGWAVVVIAALLTLAAGCEIPTEPEAPSWEVEYNIPLLDQWIDLTDLLDEEEFSDFDGDSLFFVEFEESLDPIGISDEISLSGIDQSVATTLGNFTVPAIAGQSVSVGLDQLVGAPVGIGTIPLIPDFGIPPNTTASFGASGLSGFSQVTIASGTMTVTVSNTARIPFDTLGVRLLDDGAGGAQILDLEVAPSGGTLNHDDTRVLTPSLAGLSLSNNMTVEIYGHSPGGTNVTIDGSEAIDVQVAMSDLTVSSATAEVGEIDFDHPDSFTLPDDINITAATLASGTFTLTLDNQFDIPIELTIEMPNLTDAGGAPVTFFLDTPALSQVSDVRDLSGYTLLPTDAGGDSQIIDMSINVYSPGSSGAEVTMAATDSISVLASMTDLILDSVQGILDSTTVDIAEESFDLASDSGNILDELRSVNLTDVELELTVIHSIGFPANLNLTMIGEGGTPDPVTLDIDFPLAAGSVAMPDTSVLLLNKDTSNIVDFLNAFPETVRYSGSFTIGDGVTVGTVSTSATLGADLRFSLPLAFDIVSPIEIELDKEFQADGLLDSEDMPVEFQEATLTYRLASTLGLNLEAGFYTAVDSSVVYTDPDVSFVLALQYPATTASDTVITITREQFDTLENPFWSGVKITIPPTTPGSPFKLSRDDRLYLKAFATVKVLIDPEEDSNGEGGGR